MSPKPNPARSSPFLPPDPAQLIKEQEGTREASGPCMSPYWAVAVPLVGGIRGGAEAAALASAAPHRPCGARGPVRPARYPPARHPPPPAEREGDTRGCLAEWGTRVYWEGAPGPSPAERGCGGPGGDRGCWPRRCRPLEVSPSLQGSSPLLPLSGHPLALLPGPLGPLPVTAAEFRSP